ncbi:haloacid dehalogenase superfamily, subfamily IA, variant 3 with third motif having DD or ED [Collimonas sp. OK307]|uniref:HAD family hydrolase n=1 Tax=Collimonas sp. OK307 TaxID=1801620 RepID=UPI0008F38C74|nr:HAD family hydrolase [Collimonas sp. OK307]SFH88424.1 haloacid dehalogenase superfamily, subfamily IA, variant 3 with third motif having DD or ED [Collimonas sp. OK307]
MTKAMAEAMAAAGLVPVDLVIFDCDGTLVDSETVATDVMVAYLAELGMPLSAEEALSRFKGGKMADCVTELEQMFGRALPADFTKVLRDRIAPVLHQRLQPIEGALELVKSLKVPFCMASNGPLHQIKVSLSVTGLWPYFEGRIFSAYEVSSWKPAPDLFLHAAKTMGVEPSRCAVVEDSLPGVQAGVAAGMQVFALQPEQVDAQFPAQAKIISRLAELHDHINIAG